MATTGMLVYSIPAAALWYHAQTVAAETHMSAKERKSFEKPLHCVLIHIYFYYKYELVEE